MKDSVLDQRSATIQRLSNLLAAIGTSFVFALTITSSPVAFAASGGVPSDTRTEGEWSAPFDLGMIAISAALLPTGKVLFWQYMVGSSGGSRAELWDSSGTVTDVSVPYEHDVFCGGHTFLADGRLFVAGGVLWGAAGSEIGVTHSDFFDPFTETWAPGPEMAFPRWYPYVNEAADGSD